MKSSLLIITAFLFLQNLISQNIPHANFSAPWGVQVNTFNGNLYLQRADLVIPNQGLSIDFSFAYNSFRDTLDVGYGKGWTSTYSLRYDTVATNSMILEREDGRWDIFVKNDSSYAAPAGIFDTWEEYLQDKFRLTTKFGMVYFFDEPSHRRLTRVEDTNGNAITLAYSPNGELMSVTDSSGRSVGLSWNDGHLITLTDPNFPGGRTVSFSYDDGLLTSVTDPMGNNLLYHYNDEGSLALYENEKGDEMQIGYNEQGGVAEIITCIAYTTFTYNTDQGKTYVSETNPGGDRITTYDYDEEGKLVQKTGNCCGYNTKYQYDDEP